jgi:hypothetical protein
MSKRTLKNIAKNLKKSSKVHAKQSKQIENIMKKSPAKKNRVPKAKLRKEILAGGLASFAASRPKTKTTLGRLNEKKTKLGRIKNPKNSRLIPNPANETAKKTSPALAKLSASCKAAAKRKFKVYPSAYANMWAAKTQRQGKC